MKAKLKNFIFIVITLILILFGMTIIVKNEDKQENKSRTILIEYGYYEGQKDAINGDIRLIEVKDTNRDTVMWIWTSSPWDNGQKPLYQP